MNLVDLEIQDYRQFQGTHNFSPGQHSMVAIIGQNGAGKTTLFEAIEWCLYNPNYIKNDDIRPRVHAGRPRVRVTLEHPHTGEQFEIERELKGRSVSATVYRSTQPDRPVVQGTRQVTEYVTKTLLGLSQQAFVATFFTRQKELSFFGTYGATERRREVGKLLGLETIRIAQESIGRQRQDKLVEARHKLHVFEEQSSGRDFDAERKAACEEITLRTGELQASSERLAAVNDELSARRAEIQHLQERAEAHNALRLEESELQGLVGECVAQIEAAQATLRELERAEQQIASLEAEARGLEELSGRLERHQQEKDKTDRIAEARRRQRALDDQAERVQIAVAEVRTRLDGYVSGVIAEAAPAPYDVIGEIERMAAIARSSRPEDARQNLKVLEKAHDLHVRFVSDAERLERFQREVSAIQDQIDTIRADNDPAKECSEAEKEKNAAASQASAHRAEISGLQQQRAQLDSLRSRLESGQFDEPCPTCGRPYLEEELSRDLEALRKQVAHLDSLIEQGTEAARVAEQRRLEAEARETAAKARLDELRKQEARLEHSRPHVEEARLNHEASQEELTVLLVELGRTSPPSEDELSAAGVALQQAQERERELPLLDQLCRDWKGIAEQREALQRELAELGTSAYDRDQHVADMEAWRKASDAAAQIAILQRQLETRPDVLRQLEEAEARHATALEQIETRRKALVELGYRPEELVAARNAERDLREQYEAELAEHHVLKNRLSGAEAALEAVDAEEARLQRVREASIQAQLEADELDRMYREFSRFEQYVAVSVTPALADIASQLVSAVTEGKYDRIEFTEDFGIEVYDGADDHFPLSQFSGGERDVVALCARLALSQFIGGQAESPPQFVVMDEVFGSLDKTRRENLMETLQRLLEEPAPVRQLFVISHVDDVQASSAFDEVWRVRETSVGISELERVTAASLPEEL